MKLTRLILSLSFFLSLNPMVSHAVEYACEVVGLQGIAFLSNSVQTQMPIEVGDILRVDDWIEVGKNSQVDIALDSNWKNMTRLESGSRVKIESLYPTVLNLEEGSVYARLRKLPKRSTFEVKTPTAVAAARGTIYRTIFQNNKTEVFNYSDSFVYVFGVKNDREVFAKPLVLEKWEKTSASGNDSRPTVITGLTLEERLQAADLSKGIEFTIRDQRKAHRRPSLQSIRKVEVEYLKLTSKQLSGVLAPSAFYRGDSAVYRDPQEIIEENRQKLKELKSTDESEQRVIPGLRTGRSKKRNE